MSRFVAGALLGTLTVFGGLSPASATSVPPEWTGVYTVHAGGITIRPNGKVTVSYQWYPEKGLPLPRFARLVLRVSDANDAQLTGRVVKSKRSRVKVGARFAVEQRWPGVRLTIQGSPSTWSFCDQVNRDRGECGA